MTPYQFMFTMLMQDVSYLCGSRQRAKEWFAAPNDKLGGRTPLELAKAGQLGVLRRFVNSLAVVK